MRLAAGSKIAEQDDALPYDCDDQGDDDGDKRVVFLHVVYCLTAGQVVRAAEFDDRIAVHNDATPLGGPTRGDAA